MKSLVLSFAIITCLLPMFGSAAAQDTGVRDTCRFTSGTWEVFTEQDSLFSVELWGWIDDTLVWGIGVGFKVTTSTGGGYGHDDSLIIVDSFMFNPELPLDYSISGRSLLDSTYQPDLLDWGYNGFDVGAIAVARPVLPIETSTKIGDARLKMLNPAELPDEFEILIDSSYFPPAGNFKYSPYGGEGYPPEFVPAQITVINHLSEITPLCGDATGDGNIDVDDAVFLINYVYMGGAEPDPFEAGDVNCDDVINLLDIVVIVNYMFRGGPEPCANCS